MKLHGRGRSRTDPGERIKPKAKQLSASRLLKQIVNTWDVKNEQPLSAVPCRCGRDNDPTSAVQGELRCVCGHVMELVDYRMLTDPAAIERWLTDYCVGVLTAFDFETFGLSPWKHPIVGVSFCPITHPGLAIYIPTRHRIGPNLDPETFRSLVGHFLETNDVVPHGAEFEYKFSVIGLGVVPRIVGCTEKLAWLEDLNRASRFDGRSIGLKEMADEILHIEAVEFKHMIDVKTQDFSYVPARQAVLYGAQDSDLGARLYNRLAPLVSRPAALDGQGEFLSLEYELIDVTARMEMAGLPIDVDQLQAAKPDLLKELARIEKELFAMAGREVDLGSPAQVASLLFTTCGIPIDYNFKEGIGGPTAEFPKGQPSTSKKALALIRDAYEEVDLALTWREVRYAIDNYVDKLPLYVEPATGMFHPHFNPNGTPTARYSSSGGVNVQAISKVRE